jgi:2-methylcitrate dehydratase PrpD
VATALLGGGGLGVGLDDFTGPLDPARLALAAKVRCVPDERATSIFPHAFAAVLRVHSSGRLYEHRVDASLGSVEAPLSPADLGRKFRCNAGRVLSPAGADALAVRVSGLAGLPTVSVLFAA